MSFYYLASPYSHKDPEVVKARFDQTEKATYWLLWNKYWVYSPIIHNHEISTKFKMPTDAGFWWGYNQAMLERASGLYILLIDGWKDSIGLKKELVFALERKIPIRGIEPKGWAGWQFDNADWRLTGQVGTSVAGVERA